MKESDIQPKHYLNPEVQATLGNIAMQEIGGGDGEDGGDGGSSGN